MRTWLNMADCVRRMARWKSFCGTRGCQGQSLGPATEPGPFWQHIPGLMSKRERGGVPVSQAPLRGTCPQPSALCRPLSPPSRGGAALGAQDWKARALVRMGVRPGGLGSEGTATLGETRVRLPADSSAKGSWPDTQQRVCPWTWSLWPICSRPSSPQPLVSWAQAKLWAELPPQHRGRGQSRSGQRRKGPDARAFRGDRDSTLLLITPASWGTEGWWPAPRQAGGVLGGSAPRPGGRELPGLRSCFPGRAWPASSSGTRG